MSVANTPATIAASTRQGPTGYKCPECMAAYPRRHPRQMFCCEAHRRAWDRRARLRGLQLLPFVQAARATRGGTRGKIMTGRMAQRDADMLMQRWRDEDAAAGRMRAVDFMDLRYMLGFCRP